MKVLKNAALLHKSLFLTAEHTESTEPKIETDGRASVLSVCSAVIFPIYATTPFG